jgi:phage terminase large subunit
MSPAAEHIARWRRHPAQMVRDLFDIEPDAWQVEALEAFPHAPRLAFKACKGPGKTAVLAWLGWNFLLTRPHPMIGATSISGANLRSNLWTELARWRNNSPLLQHLFEMTKSAIFAKEHPETWKMEARTWPTDADSNQIGNALAGVHAKYVMWLLDESGDYPDAIMPTCEGIFAGEPVEAHIVQAGNPTKLGGPLYRACTGARNLWRVVEISADPDNPKRTPRVSVEHAREQIQQYGRDNPWVLVNIFGQFPPSSLNALIGPDEVSAAMKRYYREYEIGDAARVLGVDVARFGDDASVIFKRQGVQAYPILKFRNIDSTQGAGQVAREWDDWQADAAFVDASGGFGSGWVDQLRQLGRPPIEVHFSGEPHDKARYYNRRAEMYFEAVAWVKRGGALPECSELLSALCATTYAFKGDRFMLAPKDDVKAKIGSSPDEADAFALTFAAPVLSRRQQERGRRRRPYSAVNDVGSWWDEPDHA